MNTQTKVILISLTLLISFSSNKSYAQESLPVINDVALIACLNGYETLMSFEVGLETIQLQVKLCDNDLAKLKTLKNLEAPSNFNVETLKPSNQLYDILLESSDLFFTES